MSRGSSLLPFVVGAAVGAAFVWLLKSDKQQIDELLEKIENRLSGDQDKTEV